MKSAGVENSLLEISSVFLRLGATSFGGPAAGIALMEEEVVRKRAWLSAQEFAEIYAVVKLLPGPVATQMAIHVGRIRASGTRGFGLATLGGTLAGVCFIFPALLLILGMSAYYVKQGLDVSSRRNAAELGGTLRFTFGAQLGALIVIVQSVWQLFRPYRGTAVSWLLFVSSALFVIPWSRWEPLWILGAGMLGVLWEIRTRRKVGQEAVRSHSLEKEAQPAGNARSFRWSKRTGLIILLGAALLFVVGVETGAWRWAVQGLNSALGQLFWVCFKAGAFVFGSGLAVVPVLEQDVVRRFAWVSQETFLEGIALGQITPGPVVITATFIGYIRAGISGAVAATLGIFLPAFLLSLWFIPPVLERLRSHRWFHRFGHYALPAVAGAIFGTSARLFWIALQQGAGGVTLAGSAAILLLGFLLNWRWKLPSWALICLLGLAAVLGGAASGRG